MIPRTREEIADHLGMKSVSYAIKTYVQPLIDAGKIDIVASDVPGDLRRRYRTIADA